MDNRETIALQTWWMSCLRRIRQNITDEEEKRQQKAARRAESLLADYESRDQILDAYGFGAITEKKKDKLLDLWEKREAETEPDSLYRAKINLLDELYQVANDIVTGRR